MISPGAIYHEQPGEVGWLSTYALTCEGGSIRDGFFHPFHPGRQV